MTADQDAYCMLCFTDWPCEQHPEWEGPIYCGMCRKGRHDQCRAFAGARKAMHPDAGPIRPEEFCACSCDPANRKVPGAGQAREWPEELRAASG